MKQIKSQIVIFYFVCAATLPVKAKTSPSDTFFTKASTDIQAKVLARGDLNNDKYEDAIVQEVSCGISCGVDIIIVLNERNKTARRLKGEDYFETYNSSGAGKTQLQRVEIKDGIISLIGKGFLDPNQENPYDVDFEIVTKTTYRLKKNKVIRLKSEKVK